MWVSALSVVSPKATSPPVLGAAPPSAPSTFDENSTVSWSAGSSASSTNPSSSTSSPVAKVALLAGAVIPQLGAELGEATVSVVLAVSEAPWASRTSSVMVCAPALSPSSTCDVLPSVSARPSANGPSMELLQVTRSSPKGVPLSRTDPTNNTVSPSSNEASAEGCSMLASGALLLVPTVESEQANPPVSRRRAIGRRSEVIAPR